MTRLWVSIANIYTRNVMLVVSGPLVVHCLLGQEVGSRKQRFEEHLSCRVRETSSRRRLVLQDVDLDDADTAHIRSSLQMRNLLSVTNLPFQYFAGRRHADSCNKPCP